MYFLLGMIGLFMGCGTDDSNLTDSLSDLKQKSADYFSLNFDDSNLIQTIKTKLLVSTSRDVEIHPGDHGSYLLSYRGIEFCEGEIKIVKHENSYSILSHLPENMSEISGSHLEINIEQTFINLEKHMGYKEVKDITYRECILESGLTFKSVLDVRASVDGYPYKFLLDERNVYLSNKRVFSAKIRAFDSNPKVGNLKDYVVETMGNGYLENDSFRTVSQRAGEVYSENDEFIFEEGEDAFHDASSFSHANEHRLWFLEQALQFDGEQIEIQLSDNIGGTSNNAAFIPDYNGKPTILLGYGDGEGLENLTLDADVVSHEYTHAVLFQYLHNETEESQVVHEALADFFTFARTDDPCLGESICPQESEICEVKNQCLRSADNDLVLDVNTSHQYHTKSQFLSGLLWDLRSSLVPKEKLDAIMFDGVKMLLKKSGYHDLILAMLLIDQEAYGGEYCPVILSAAKKRGLENSLNGLSCRDDMGSFSFTGEESKPALNQGRSAGSGLACSVSSGSGNPFSLFWFLLPFIRVVLRSKKSFH